MQINQSISASSTKEELFERIKDYPFTARLINAILEIWQTHIGALRKSILCHYENDIPLLERLSENILLLIGDDLNCYLESYRWMCDVFNEEQLFLQA